MTTRNINALADAQALGWADARFTRLAANSVSLNGRMSFSGQSLTGSQADSLLGLAATWNTTGTPTAFDLNVTDTASDAASLLMDLQVGGVSRLAVDKAGKVLLTRAQGIADAGATTNALFWDASGRMEVRHTGTYIWGYRPFGPNEFQIGANSVLTFGSSAATSNGTVRLTRDGANDVLAMERSTNAQTFRLYNTYTDASNYERGFMRWDTNVLLVGTAAAGTGTRRDVKLDGNNRSAYIATPTNEELRDILISHGLMAAS